MKSFLAKGPYAICNANAAPEGLRAFILTDNALLFINNLTPKPSLTSSQPAPKRAFREGLQSPFWRGVNP